MEAWAIPPRLDKPTAAMRQVFFEFTRVGNVRKVNAIDAETGVEVAMIWAPGYSQRVIEQLAARKLEYVLRKRRERAAENDTAGRKPGGFDKLV